MGIERGISLKGLSSGWSAPPKPCDSCKSAPAALFCRADSAFLCIACDSRIHCAINLALRHERVWMCEVCEQAPASVTCKADAAALCVTCDFDIHSANPLARRHERVPVEPFFDSAAESIAKASAAAFNFAVPSTTDNGFGSDGFNFKFNHDDPDEAVSWLMDDTPDIKSGETFITEMDSFLDFDDSNCFRNNNHCAGNDIVVPVQSKTAMIPTVMNHRSDQPCFDIDFCRSKLSLFNNYPTQSLSQSVSSSSLEVGVVPEGKPVSEISYPTTGNSEASQLCGMDREARVLRYREKRKNRKFEKTIRYASRKAYAETRPRIKGRFAKRTETESGVDRLYSLAAAPGALVVDPQYGVVPSF